MNYTKSTINTAMKIILVTVVMASVISCGGGGSEGSSSSNVSTNVVRETVEPPSIVEPITQPSVEPSIDYTADSEKLLSPADSSSELFVESTFTFNSYKSVIFDIDVTDVNNQPISDLMLSISIIPSEVSDLDDPLLNEKSLISRIKTNNNGRAYLNIELPQSTDNILLELNALGIENDVIFPIDSSGVVIHHFTQNK